MKIAIFILTPNTSHPNFALQEQSEWLLQQAFDFLQEARGHRAIDGAMIRRKRDLHAVAHNNLPIDNGGRGCDRSQRPGWPIPAD